MHRVRETVRLDSEVRTKQAPRDGTSVEEQLRRYRDAGLVPAGGRTPKYGDFTGVGDYQECLQRVTQARVEFEALPAAVRLVAANDPGVFLEMVYGGRPEMLKALCDAGLAEVCIPEGAKAALVENGDSAKGVPEKP